MPNIVRKEKLSIYLMKGSAQSIESYLKIEMISASHSFQLKNGKGTLFVKREPNPKPPLWTHLFTDHPDAPIVEFGYGNNVGAVFHLVADERNFLLSFGSGFHLIQADMIERDFGLRVTLNAVEQDKLRSLDKASYDDNPLNSRTQSTLHVDIFDLQANSESDLIYAVTGACKIPILGSHITGRDALTLMVETDLNHIEAILATAAKLFDAPLPETYAWIDNISKVKDGDTVALLDLLLDDQITDAASGNLWLGEPEIVEWESNAGYSFEMYKNSERHQVLSIDALKEHLVHKNLPFDLNTIKHVNVHINNSDYISIHSWSAYRCIYAEVDNGEDKYIIRNGVWYKIESSFINQIDAQLAKIPLQKCDLPPYCFTNEGDYNKHAADADNNLHLMDKKNIKTGGPYDKIEFCDLIEGRSNFIHVKYYRSSATLSHLFSQGAVAGETFVKDENFREKLNLKLPRHIALADTSRRPDAGEYIITYAIATNKKIPSELPFFSKVSLKNAAARLFALGYKVSLIAIPIDPLLPKTKKIRPGR